MDQIVVMACVADTVQKIFRRGAGKIHSLKYHFQMIGTGYSYHPALFL
ncbi:MAG: hypothetical protein MR404_05955 [Prevotellaceae bacterium]|nr:hypothetical protein [Prevotellaceae bacterium]